MKSTLYAGILSVISGCASTTAFTEYPVTVDGTKVIYVKNSNGDCDLKMPLSDGNELRIYDRHCDGSLDSVAKASVEERFYFHHDREELTENTKKNFDDLLRKTQEQASK